MNTLYNVDEHQITDNKSEGSDSPTLLSSKSSISDSDSTLTSSNESTSCNSESSEGRSARVTAMRVHQKLASGANKSKVNDIFSSNDTDATSSSTVASVESVKRYKNSPFGLNHHYLTMPEPIEKDSQFYKSKEIDYTDSDGDRESFHKRENQDRGHYGSSSIKRNTNKEIKRKRNHEATTSNQNKEHLKDHQPNGVSTSVPESGSQLSLSSPVFCDYQDRRGIDRLKSHGMVSNDSTSVNNFPSHLETLSPAFDAGLDAKRCSAKSYNDYFIQDINSQSCLNESKLRFPDVKLHGSECLMVKFGSIMYATFLVILGCILHCSELGQRSKNSTDHIYTIIIASIGICWLLFLQGDLQRYKRYATKYISTESIFKDHRQKMREMNHSVDPTSQSTASSSASLVNDRMSMNTEVIFKKTAYKMYQQRAKTLSQNEGLENLTQAYQNLDKPENSNPAEFHYPDSYPKGPISYSHNKQNEQRADYLVPAYKYLHGKMGANFYLKCGMAAFCFGHVIHEGLRFGEQLYFFSTGNVHQRDLAALLAHLITPLYSFYQLFMMFKYSNLVINRHRVLAKFGLMHIVGTSINFWIRTILEEAYEDFIHKMKYFKVDKPLQSLTNQETITNSSNNNLITLINSMTDAIKAEASEETGILLTSQNISGTQTIWALMSSPIPSSHQSDRDLTDPYACTHSTLLTAKSLNALPYLYPFTIEYNLLLAATFLSLYFNIGKISPNDTSCEPFNVYNHEYRKRVNRTKNSLASSPISQIESSDNLSITKSDRKDNGEYKSNFVINADCHSANKGLFCGFFVLLVTLVTIVIFFVTINKPTHIQLGIKINLIQEGTLTALILIVTLASFRQISNLNRNPFLRDKITTDDVLMLIPLPFFFFHSLLSLRAETASLFSNNDSSMRLGNKLILNTTRNQFPRFNSNFTNASVRAENDNITLDGHRNRSSGQLLDIFINLTKGDTVDRKGKSIVDIGAGNDSSQIDHFKLITVVLNIVVMIEVLVQTNFIIDGMRRCSESRYLRFKKPGRELITFAILLNITYWIVATFETKSVEQYKPEIEYYGPLPYMFISHTTLPVMLFYRYHSSVCLAEIWNRAYKLPKRH